jgi:transposase-like protein
MDVTKVVPQTLMEVILYFSEPRTCVEFMARMRWGAEGPSCPRCESKRLSFLETRLMWKCLDCQKQFSVKVNSIFEDSPIGLDKWLCAMWLIANCRNGVSSYEIARDLKVSQKAAWFMLQRIRHAMATGTFTKLSGEIEIDESFIGGKVRNMHKGRKAKVQAGGKREGDNKTVVLGVLKRKGEVRATVVQDRKKKNLSPFVIENVATGATIHTDEFSKGWYGDDQFIHNVVNHAVEYVDGNVHTNGMENFWSLLKRGLGGTYISVEPFHLFRYLDEQMFRYNNRNGEDGKPLSDADRFVKLCTMVAGRRLTWNQVTGKTAVGL